MTQTSYTDQAVDRSASLHAPLRRATFMIPVVLVNLAALVGQSLWFYGQITAPGAPLDGLGLPGAISAVLFGIALESISAYLALQAHAALLADQASGGLRLGSYLVAAVVAALNLTHFSGADLGELGIGFALFSLVSPWLWAIDSRSAHRAIQAAKGLVDPAGVKLSSSRKFWHPRRSVAVIRHAAWLGETDPARAVSDWERTQSVGIQSADPIRAEVITDQPAPSPQTRTRTAPIRAQIADRPESVAGDVVDGPAEETETVTETVTRTETQTRVHSVSRQAKRAERLRERVESVKVARPDWQSTELTYDEIRDVLGLRGAEVIKPIYAVLYRGETVESVLLAHTKEI